MTIHAQLLADCHVLGKTPSGHLLLHQNAAVTWLILVPAGEYSELHQLPDDLLSLVMSDVTRLAGVLQHLTRADKMNVAALGNQVPQLHIHIIARHHHDACWPLPVWGNLPDVVHYSQEQRVHLITALHEKAGLLPLV